MDYQVKLSFRPDTGSWAAEAYDERGRIIAVGTGHGVVKALDQLAAQLERLRNAKGSGSGSGR